MIDVKKINWEKLMNGNYKYFSWFYPNVDKMSCLSQKLQNEYLYLSDEHRNPTKIWQYLLYYFPPDFNMPITNLSIFYEIGDFDGIVGFTDIIPEFKCFLQLRPWNVKKLFRGMKGREFLREGTSLIKTIQQEFKLKRIESSTPDKDIVRLAKIMGFKQEGAQPYAFRWDGKYHTSYPLALTKDKRRK